MGPPRFELGSPAPKAGRITRLPHGPKDETGLHELVKNLSITVDVSSLFF